MDETSKKLLIESENYYDDIDILSTNYPLIVEFRTRAPGTFKHSQQVANTTEVVATQIGIDSELMKICGLYHDIGKMLYPYIFTENQTNGHNIHDTLTPDLSYYLITRHVSDSVAILINDRNISRKVIEIISQHHGTTVCKSLYNKTKDKSHIDNFRYKTHKPTSVEAMVLMLIDVLEATTRSYLQNHIEFDPAELVHSVITQHIQDGQFDEVEMKLRLLTQIEEALISDVISSFQKRIDYGEE